MTNPERLIVSASTDVVWRGQTVIGRRPTVPHPLSNEPKFDF